MKKILIPQHDGSSNQFADMANFLEDIDNFISVTEWEYSVDWCVGDKAGQLEELSMDRAVVTDSAFRELYAGIKQTIDGEFILKNDDTVLAKFQAIDSTYWKIESDNHDFLSHIEKKYGEFQYPSRRM